MYKAEGRRPRVSNEGWEGGGDGGGERRERGKESPDRGRNRKQDWRGRGWQLFK